MGLKNLLEEKRSAIVKQWFDQVVETYPADTSRFLKKQSDPFANPVGQTTQRGLQQLLDELLGEMDRERIETCLDPIIRIRAIQSFTPSQATGFVFFLKTILRKIAEEPHRQDLSRLEGRIDEMALVAFDIYTRCRETLFRIRADEERRVNLNALKRAGLISSIPENGPDL